MNRTEQLQDRYVKVGSVNTRYWQAGDSDSTVILLHGGGVALTCTLNFPELVDRLILVSSAGLGKEINFLLRVTTLPGLDKLFSSPSRSSIAMFCKQAVYDSKLITDEVVEEFYQMARLPGAAKATLNVGRSNFNIWGQFYRPIAQRLPTIVAPTLIIWGRQDPMVPVAQAQNAIETIPNARLEIIEECGHWSPIEYSQKFNQLVLEFLSRLA
ncbi:MAG: alpha/beta fold hydrolase [Hydrococcus sp. Prado102]|jgi:4,5:9,10-diseco-3-hydroxy-5,9,17-trioxoandrosta-1(10),2-diene-4-oate hydrolase|nr:alpha/beta fold hydrolase [Hydrococcus sp. Prado102]